VGATNLGRDTDCIGGMLGSICGAYKGIAGVPAEWCDLVQGALDRNRVTLQKMSMEETAQRLTGAVRANLERLRRQVTELDQLDSAEATQNNRLAVAS
jgi:hypothetical protein